MSKYKYGWLCKLFGHRYSVVWNLQKSVATFCTRCGSWENHVPPTTKGASNV